MQNNFRLMVVFLSLIAGLAGLAMEIQQPTALSHTLLLGFDLAYIMAVVHLLQQSRFIKSAYFKKVRFCIAVIILGVLLRLMHWP